MKIFVSQFGILSRIFKTLSGFRKYGSFCGCLLMHVFFFKAWEASAASTPFSSVPLGWLPAKRYRCVGLTYWRSGLAWQGSRDDGRKLKMLF
jgi:hypothetical protein